MTTFSAAADITAHAESPATYPDTDPATDPATDTDPAATRRIVAVLGLGRLGSAVADRLRRGHEVRGWTRSQHRSPAAADAALTAAVAGADVVLVVLYDAAACRTVLDRAMTVMTPGVEVVNLTTVAADEAAELDRIVTAGGCSYTHLPVIGSTPAAAAGALVLLAGGESGRAARDVLSQLGPAPIDATSARVAASAKLVVNGLLAEVLVALGRSLGQARALALPDDLVEATLTRSVVGGLVAAKRDVLFASERPPSAQFAIGTLGKDLELLTAAVSAEPPALATIRASVAAGLSRDDDVAWLAARTTEVPPDLRIDATDAKLCLAPGVIPEPGPLRPLVSYAHGHATGNSAYFRRAFRPTAHIEGLRADGYCSWDLDTYCGQAVFNGVPAADEVRRRRVVERLDVSGGIATAAMRLQHGANTFVDLFLLVADPSVAGSPPQWRIANKVYERRATVG